MAGHEHDLGDHHTLVYTSWTPVREHRITSSQPVAVIVSHPDRADPDGHRCHCIVTITDRLRSFSPVSMDGDIVCPCGDHGRIVDGHWSAA